MSHYNYLSSLQLYAQRIIKSPVTQPYNCIIIMLLLLYIMCIACCDQCSVLYRVPCSCLILSGVDSAHNNYFEGVPSSFHVTVI